MNMIDPNDPYAFVDQGMQPQPKPSLNQRFNTAVSGGLGRIGQGLFAVDPTVENDIGADQAGALRGNAMLRMGLGMLGASSGGARFGEALNAGYQSAANDLNGSMQNAFRNAHIARGEQRQIQSDTEQRENRKLDNERADRALTAQTEANRLAAEQRKEEREALQAWRDQQSKYEADRIANERARIGLADVPSGYRKKADGSIEPIPGGPADPHGPGARKATQPLRKEFRSLQTVKDYETVLPIIESAKKAPDNGYGDLQLIYSAGKILDPGSVVREGELALTVAAGSPLQRILGTTRFTAEQGGRLTPQTRQQLIGMLSERTGALKQAYDRDYAQYSEYAKEAQIDPSQVVGDHAESAFAPKAPVAIKSDAEYDALPSGSVFTGPDGQQRRKP